MRFRKICGLLEYLFSYTNPRCRIVQEILTESLGILPRVILDSQR